MKSIAYIAFFPLAVCAYGADTANAPMDWQPVRTNEIARWKAERNAPEGVFSDRAARTVTFLMEANGLYCLVCFYFNIESLNYY